jgi:hypothetical protein
VGGSRLRCDTLLRLSLYTLVICALGAGPAFTVRLKAEEQILNTHACSTLTSDWSIFFWGDLTALS